MHVGGGRTGISTGAGPFSFYTSLGAGRRGGGRRATSPASYQRQIVAQQRLTNQQQRLQAAQELADSFVHILNLHRVEFPAATPPVAPPPPLPDRAAIYRYYEDLGLAGVGRLQVSKRTQAKRQAAEQTDAEMTRQLAEGQAAQRRYQEYLNQRWHQLRDNDPDVVMQTLEEAFEDNEAAAATAGVEAGEASIAILVPPMINAVPERMPGTTQAGNLTLRKLTQRERADFYKIFVCGQVLATVREAFAVAPGLTATRTIVLRNDGRDAYGKTRVSCILAVKFDSAALSGIQWNTADAPAIVNDAASETVIQQKGRSQELGPLDLTSEPGIAGLIAAVDLEELTDAGTSHQADR